MFYMGSNREYIIGGEKMDNFARHEYDGEIDYKVKEELQIANIPVFRLPYYMIEHGVIGFVVAICLLI